MADAISDQPGALGGIKVLINSAAILRLSALLDVTVDDWDTIFIINTRAMLTTMQAAARAFMSAEPSAKIIHVAPVAAKMGGAGKGTYAALK